MKRILMLGVLGLSVFANAEIVTNSKGEKIELKANGTWVKATGGDVKGGDLYKINKDDLLFSEKIITANPNPLVKRLKNGDDQEVDVKINFMVGIPEMVGFL